MSRLSVLVLFLSILSTIWLACGEPDTSFGPVDQTESPNQTARATWQSNDIDNYTIDQKVGFWGPAGFQGWVQLEIEDNEIAGAVNLGENREPENYEIIWFRTIDDLFDLIESSSDADYVVITYDSIYGYPNHIFINGNTGVRHDEIYYKTNLIHADN
ncbi:MAG: hypothetical protein KOO62_00890 [candidate division Zixibacteria bacterium]|nr:hypothetical protein [candidate division Zixibacteria bacterium]